MTAGLDWQFVVVTLAAVWGGWVLLRPLWRERGKKTGTSCGRCSSPDCMKGSASDLVRSGAERKT